MTGPEMHCKSWTAEEENRLLELYKAGATFHQIAIKLGRTPGAVIAKFQRQPWRCGRSQNRAGLNARTWDAEMDAVLLDLAKECNLDFNEVGKKLGRPAKLCMNRYLALQKKRRAGMTIHKTWSEFVDEVFGDESLAIGEKEAMIEAEEKRRAPPNILVFRSEIEGHEGDVTFGLSADMLSRMIDATVRKMWIDAGPVEDLNIFSVENGIYVSFKRNGDSFGKGFAVEEGAEKWAEENLIPVRIDAQILPEKS